MILNSKSNQFFINFQEDFLYPEVEERWLPIIKRFKLPYESTTDYINACVQSVTFPSVELEPRTQQQSQFQIAYRGGKELEPVLDKNLTITFKLSESYVIYWMLFDQTEKFMEYSDKIPFWPPMYISFLDHFGFEIVNFSFNEIIPTNISPFTLTYATNVAEFTTFTMNLRYNRFQVKYKIDSKNTNIGKSN